jgi:hypothetical protein
VKCWKDLLIGKVTGGAKEYKGVRMSSGHEFSPEACLSDL